MNAGDHPTSNAARLAGRPEQRTKRRGSERSHRRDRNIAAARTMLGQLARVGSILEPIASTPGSTGSGVAAVLDDLDTTTSALIHVIQSGHDDGESVRRIQSQLCDLEARLRSEWVEQLGDALTSELDRLAEACRLLHGAASAFQSGTVS